MFPKFDEVAISTYLSVLAKIRRPSMIPSASTPRSLSSSTMSAASFATSVADSTEMPTSAACRATASLTPSPRKATSTPPRRASFTNRDFCSGPTRPKIVVPGMAAASASSSRRSISAPLSTPSTGRPMSRQTLAATVPLSPVMTLTLTPSPPSVAMAAAASALGRSTNVRKPASFSPLSSSAEGSVRSGAPSGWRRRRPVRPPRRGARGLRGRPRGPRRTGRARPRARPW